jgi:hypothetical protein
MPTGTKAEWAAIEIYSKARIVIYSHRLDRKTAKQYFGCFEPDNYNVREDRG